MHDKCRQKLVKLIGCHCITEDIESLLLWKEAERKKREQARKILDEVTESVSGFAGDKKEWDL